MRAYSYDLRERVVRACDAGRGTRQQIADLFGVSTAWVRRLLQRRRETGAFAARPHAGGPPPKLTPGRCDRLAVLVSEQPDATLAELRDRLAAGVHLSTVARALARLGLTVKKKVLWAAERDRPDVRHKRASYRGRAPRGQRLAGAVPQAHWQMTTLAAGIRADGAVAPLALKGAMGAASFEAYVTQVLVPCLRPGDLVVLDRLQAHRGRAVARAVRRAGAGVWLLPPYSPDYNPIECLWPKVKGALRTAEPRTTEALWQALPPAVAAVTAQDCQHSFAHCGYHATPDCEAL